MMRSLRLRLAIGAALAIAIALVTVWFALSRLFTLYVVEQYRAELVSISDMLVAHVRVGPDSQMVLDDAPSDPRFDLPGSGRYWQISSAGLTPLRSRSLWDTVIDPAAPVAPDDYGFARMEGPDGAAMLVRTEQVTLGDGASARSVTVHTAFPALEFETALKGFHGQLLLMLLVTAGLLTAAAILQGHIGLRPLSALRDRVAQIRTGTLRNIGLEGPSELAGVVGEINLLLAERETAVSRARARASDLAHGLKTPLTVLLQLAERLPPEDRELARRQVDMIRQRADRQLQAARMGVEQMATTELSSLTGKLVAVLRPVVADRAIAWDLAIDETLTLAADPADLAEALGNLLDNAARFARSNIRISALHQGSMVEISVEDDGPGVDAQAIDHILRRGSHLEPEGSGLGLAITGDIASAYGGSLRLGRSGLGGLRAVLSLPLGSEPFLHPATG